MRIYQAQDGECPDDDTTVPDFRLLFFKKPICALSLCSLAVGPSCLRESVCNHSGNYAGHPCDAEPGYREGMSRKRFGFISVKSPQRLFFVFVFHLGRQNSEGGWTNVRFVALTGME